MDSMLGPERRGIGCLEALCSYCDVVGPVECRWIGIGENGPHHCARMKERKELRFGLPPFRQEMLRAWTKVVTDKSSFLMQLPLYVLEFLQVHLHVEFCFCKTSVRSLLYPNW